MTYTANIQQAYRSATAHDQAQGLQWYGEAARIARALAVDSSLTPEQTAGVIAALSPMNGWRVNLMLAERLILTHRAGTSEPSEGMGLKRNVHKAWRILDGEAPLDVLSGPKVRSFYRNILGDPDAVTVDRWAARIARDDPADAGLVTAKQYREIEAAYREAADNLGVTARELQAAVWVYFRRLHGHAQYDPAYTPKHPTV